MAHDNPLKLRGPCDLWMNFAPAYPIYCDMLIYLMKNKNSPKSAYNRTQCLELARKAVHMHALVLNLNPTILSQLTTLPPSPAPSSQIVSHFPPFSLTCLLTVSTIHSILPSAAISTHMNVSPPLLPPIRQRHRIPRMPFRNLVPLPHKMRNLHIDAPLWQNLAQPTDVFYEGGEVAGPGAVALGEGGCEEFGEVGFGGVGGAREEAVNGGLVGF
jgi:hypothetical protein